MSYTELGNVSKFRLQYSEFKPIINFYSLEKLWFFYNFRGIDVKFGDDS